MERPKVNPTPRERQVTGEIVYLDSMRKARQVPGAYLDQSDMATQLYEQEAACYASGGVRPAIMGEFEQHDVQLGPSEASCVALADELLELKTNNRLTFADIVLDRTAEETLEQVKSTRLGQVLAADDEQLAIESDGSYYPVLDITKANCKLIGSGLRVWGWDYEKYAYLHKPDEQYNPGEHVLVYPADEKKVQRQLELQFSYQVPDGGIIVESVSLWVGDGSGGSISSNVWMSAYAETGYEGHKSVSLAGCSDQDVATFGDIVAEAAGDQPETVQMHDVRKLREWCDKVPSVAARMAVERLVDATWPAQAIYLLGQAMEGGAMTVAAGLMTDEGVEQAIGAIDQIIASYREHRG